MKWPAFPLLFACSAGAPLHAGEQEIPVAVEPRHVWELSAETLQTVGVDDSGNDYFATQFISVTVEPFRPLVAGPVTMRLQLVNSFVVSAILDGPDHYFLGWAPGLRVILPLGASGWSLYGNFAAGLGAADADAGDPDDRGFGQSFNYLLSASAGVRRALSPSWSVWAGGAWLHLSNGNMSEPRKENIGVDSFGVVVGAGWAF
ncbi:MAG: acyloxyacyl hydrolase [Chthoniobacterales bacterium]